jgi:hypothetical protein
MVVHTDVYTHSAEFHTSIFNTEITYNVEDTHGFCPWKSDTPAHALPYSAFLQRQLACSLEWSYAWPPPSVSPLYFCVGLHLLQCRQHFHSRDLATSASFRWNYKRAELWRSHTNRGLMLGLENFKSLKEPNFRIPVRIFLQGKYPERCLSKRKPVPCPTLSPDLNLLYFYLLGHVESHVYVTAPNDVADLQKRMEDRCELICNTPWVLSAWENP